MVKLKIKQYFDNVSLIFKIQFPAHSVKQDSYQNIDNAYCVYLSNITCNVYHHEHYLNI